MNPITVQILCYCFWTCWMWMEKWRKLLDVLLVFVHHLIYTSVCSLWKRGTLGNKRLKRRKKKLLKKKPILKFSMFYGNFAHVNILYTIEIFIAFNSIWQFVVFENRLRFATQNRVSEVLTFLPAHARLLPHLIWTSFRFNSFRILK